METKIMALKAEIELHKKHISEIIRQISEKFSHTINTVMLKESGAQIIRDVDVRPYGDEIYFEVGFYNPDEERIDFGSDMSFYYKIKSHKLSCNYGTIGSYTSDDIYQVKRVMLLASIWSNITEIEVALAEACSSIIELEKPRSALNECEIELRSCERKIKEAELEKIMADLSVGDRFEYEPNFFKMFVRRNYVRNTQVIVKSIGPKKIKLEFLNGTVRMIDMSDFLNHIWNNKCVKISD